MAQLTGVLSSLNQRLLTFAKSKAKPVQCKACGNTFKPFEDQAISSWGELVGDVTCPACGKQVELLRTRERSSDGRMVPEGRVPQPADSRIERHQISDREVLYHIPATGNGGFLLFFAIPWNCFILFFTTVWFLAEGQSGKSPGIPMPLFLLPFYIVGVVMAYVGLRAKYAAHLLFLGPEIIRLQSQFFGRRTNRDLPTLAITRVGQKVFYTQNYRAVYGVEISAGRRRIRFGSALEEGEKRWLCAELREYLHSEGNSHFAKDESLQEVLKEWGAGGSSSNLQSAVSAVPLKRAIIESLGHDSLMIQIPRSGRCGAWLPIALILTGTIVFGGVLLFSGLLPGFEEFRRMTATMEWFFGFGLLVTAILTALTWYGALRHRNLQQRISADRFEFQLETELFGKKWTRLLATKEITRIDLLEIMRINGEPVHAVRVVSAKESLRFGSTLPEEDKVTLVALLREFLVRQGAPVSETGGAAATADAP